MLQWYNGQRLDLKSEELGSHRSLYESNPLLLRVSVLSPSRSFLKGELASASEPPSGGRIVLQNEGYECASTYIGFFWSLKSTYVKAQTSVLVRVYTARTSQPGFPSKSWGAFNILCLGAAES
jgi:hypothetical protein